MMQYRTGEKVEIGDNVLFQHGQTKGVIEVILETPETLAEGGLKEDDIGVLVASEPYGLLLTSIADEHDEIIFVSRK